MKKCFAVALLILAVSACDEVEPVAPALTADVPLAPGWTASAAEVAMLKESIREVDLWLREATVARRPKLLAFRRSLERDLSLMTSSSSKAALQEGDSGTGVIDEANTYTVANIRQGSVTVKTTLKWVMGLPIMGELVRNSAVSIDPEPGRVITTQWSHTAWGNTWTSTSKNLFAGQFSCLSQSGYMTAVTEHLATIEVTLDHFPTKDADECIATGQAIITGGPTTIRVNENGILDSPNCLPTNRIWSSSNHPVATVGTHEGLGLVIGNSVGQAAIKLSCPKQSLTDGTVIVTVTAPEPCDDDSGGGGDEPATLRVAALMAISSSAMASLEDCPPPSSGGGGPEGELPPPNSPPESCYWARNVIIWADGSWDWISDWYIVCTTPAASLQEANSAAESSIDDFVDISIVAGRPMGTGRAAEVIRASGPGAELEILLDTAIATPIDVAHALDAARRLREREGLSTDRVFVGTAIPAAVGKSRGSSSLLAVEAQLLQELKRAPIGRSVRGASGRRLIHRLAVTRETAVGAPGPVIGLSPDR